ncbi:MAG: matrixin family metalloprotease [Acidobacteriota bacterium]
MPVGFALVALMLGVPPQRVAASSAPTWAVGDLWRFSDVIVSGRVDGVVSGWEAGAGAIYTWVLLDVDEVFKGAISAGPLAVKQLGGLVGDTALSVIDQATFVSGERVLLFLEARPRDRSLYTAGLWQGKWQVVTFADGERVALRGGQALPLSALRQSGMSAASVTVGDGGEWSRPTVGHQRFMLMTTPFRYTFLPTVELQAGGQPGLPGGGVAEVQAAVQAWNAAGAAFRFLPGSSSSPPRCASQFLGTYGVTISYLDPCGEISNSGGTLAVGGSYFTMSASISVSGQPFRLALEGFIINNDSPIAQEFLNVSGCFQDIQLHELGHVLGLGHSSDPSAIMFPSLNRDCAGSPSALGPDDLAGIHFIYPLSLGGVPGSVSVQRASAIGELLTIDWTLGPGAAPTSHRLDFFVGSALAVTIIVGPATTVSLPLAAGTAGTFSVQVTAFAGLVPGPTSPPFAFAIGASCTEPPPTPAIVGGVVNGIAMASWVAVPGVIHYLFQAGTSPGASDLVPLTNIGTTTGVSASGVVPGFAAWVRVIAVNDCGSSVPADFLVR